MYLIHVRLHLVMPDLPMLLHFIQQRSDALHFLKTTNSEANTAGVTQSVHQTIAIHFQKFNSLSDDTYANRNKDENKAASKNDDSC